MMRKKVLNTIFISLFLMIFLPLSVSAKSISTLSATVDSNNKLNVSGTTEEGVLAVAVFVYSGDDLAHMETCSVNNAEYSCKLSKTFTSGNYTVKVADYDGGNYITKNVTVVEPTPENNPSTYDGIIFYIGIGIVSLIGVTGTALYIKKKCNN